MTNQLPNTREEKIQLLKDLMAGKRSINSLRVPSVDGLGLEELRALKEALAIARADNNYVISWYDLIEAGQERKDFIKEILTSLGIKSESYHHSIP